MTQDPYQTRMSVGHDPIRGDFVISSPGPASQLGKLQRPLAEEMQRVAQDRGAIQVTGRVSATGEISVFDPGPLNPTRGEAARILEEPGPFGQG